MNNTLKEALRKAAALNGNAGGQQPPSSRLSVANAGREELRRTYRPGAGLPDDIKIGDSYMMKFPIKPGQNKDLTHSTRAAVILAIYRDERNFVQAVDIVVPQGIKDGHIGKEDKYNFDLVITGDRVAAMGMKKPCLFANTLSTFPAISIANGGCFLDHPGCVSHVPERFFPEISWWLWKQMRNNHELHYETRVMINPDWVREGFLFRNRETITQSMVRSGVKMPFIHENLVCRSREFKFPGRQQDAPEAALIPCARPLQLER